MLLHPGTLTVLQGQPHVEVMGTNGLFLNQKKFTKDQRSVLADGLPHRAGTRHDSVGLGCHIAPAWDSLSIDSVAFGPS